MVTENYEKGDSRHSPRAGWLVALPLLGIGCAHGVTISAMEAEELTMLACDAQTKCQRHADKSDENWPDLPIQDRACILLANEYRAAVKSVCK